MICNCTPVCSVSQCVETLTIGTIAPDTTVLVQFKDIVTGRIKQITATSDENGLLIADVSSINNFFSANLVYELSVLANNTSQCQTINITIGETEIYCALIKFAAYQNQTGVLSIDSPILPEIDDYRITDDGELRITENQDNRIL